MENQLDQPLINRIIVEHDSYKHCSESKYMSENNDGKASLFDLTHQIC